MRIPIRLIFAILLWAVAACAPALYLLHLESPAQAVAVALDGRLVLGRGILVAITLGVIAALLYPPFVPSVRLYLRRMKVRMSVDQAPMMKAIQELQHLETPAKHVDVARVAQSLGNLRLAIPHLLRAAELEPDALPTRYQLGCALSEARLWPQAVEHLGFVAERDPSHAFGEVLVELGGALLALGRAAEALAVLQRHRAEHGSRRKTSLWIARASRAVGDQAACRAALTEAAAAPKEGERLTHEDALFRARARVGLWTWGRG